MSLLKKVLFSCSLAIVGLLYYIVGALAWLSNGLAKVGRKLLPTKKLRHKLASSLVGLAYGTNPASLATTAKIKVRRSPQALKEFSQSHRKELVLITVLLTISLVAHAWNMFYFPYFENDEATYTARAWTFITSGQLDVYTYRYDHAPLGWMLLGLWQILAGGADLFGSLLASGRVFMLIIHVAATGLVYVLAKRFSGGSKLAATVAVLFFALSPIAIYFQRRILLDNIMTFWFLLSLYFATQPKQRLKNYILSAITFGVAVLTKLNAIFFAPAILLIVWLRSHKHHRLHASAYWSLVAGMVIASFFIFALLKGELFAAPIGPDGNPVHVSVVDTFKLQLGRGDFAWPWKTESSFMQNVQSWWLKDWSILALGAASTLLLGGIGYIKRKTHPQILVLVGLILLYVAFLARGKIVLDLYVVPLIPLLALAIGVLVGVVYQSLTWKRKTIYSLHLTRPVSVALRVVCLLAVVGGGVLLATQLPTKHYTRDETTNQLAAVRWAKNHIPAEAIIATDNYLYPYLAQEDNFQNVSYFFSTEYDPEIRATYQNDWRNIEYLVLTHEIVKQIKTGTVPRMKEVLDHATLVADYREGASSYIDLPNYISTNGDWVQIYKIKDRNGIVQQDSWAHFKGTFVVDYGQVIDLSNNSLTTSGAQAQAMLRAVAEDDKDMFGGLWQWSKDHLRYRSDDKLLSWQWQLQTDGSYKLGDSNTVCDADQQIAYALFLADTKWPGQGYRAEAETHIQDWWRQCTFTIGEERYIDSSADGSQDQRLVNTGYFRPEIYRYLSRHMPELNWQDLTNDGFSLLERVHSQYGTVPDWIIVNPDGSLTSAAPLIGESANAFGYDALQLVPSLTEYHARSQDPRANAMLDKLATPLQNFAATTKTPPVRIAELMMAQTRQPFDQSEVQATYETVVAKPYKPTQGYWGGGRNYRDQVWYWQWHHLQASLPLSNQPQLK